MSRGRATIPPRRRIFLGCEGESEQGYGALLSRLAEEMELHLALQVTLLRPGGGDPLDLVERAAALSRRAERQRGAFMVKAVLLDGDKLGESPARDQRIYPLAQANDLHLIWQEPCHEAMLLRHLPACGNLRPPTAAAALQELTRRWAAYRKPMPAMRLAVRIGRSEIFEASAVEPALREFLRHCGLAPAE